MTPEEAALKSSSEIDTRAFTWTFDSLDEDHELDRFFSGMPGFHNSRVLKQPLHNLDDQQKLRLLEAVIRLLDRTFSSNLLSDQVKRKRADICAKAIEVVETPDAFPKIVRRLASEDGYGPVQSSQIVDFVRRWGDRKGEYSTLDQAIFSIVVARVQQRDDSWFNLASDQLGVPETVLRSHAAHGDNLSFAILIYVTRQQFSHIRNPSWPSNTISNVLEAASKFNVQDTSPELQHEFCASGIKSSAKRRMTTIGRSRAYSEADPPRVHPPTPRYQFCPVPPAAALLQPNAGTLTPSVRLTVPASAPSAPGFDNTITTSRSLSFLLPILI
jgi:hypothetical protein